MKHGNKIIKKNKKWLYWTLIPVSILLIIAILFIPTKTVTYQVSVPYEEQEEYTKTESYSETVPYTDQECENKDFSYAVENIKRGYDNNYFWISFDIVNHEDEGGYFRYDTTFHTVKYGDKTEGTSSYVYAKSRILFPQLGYELKYTGQEVSAENPTITPPQKRVCNEVIKYKEIQKERQVTAYRPVSKTRQETRTKQVNWIFGYEV